jgi:hypothetical protein
MTDVLRPLTQGQSFLDYARNCSELQCVGTANVYVCTADCHLDDLLDRLLVWCQQDTSITSDTYFYTDIFQATSAATMACSDQVLQQWHTLHFERCLVDLAVFLDTADRSDVEVASHPRFPNLYRLFLSVQSGAQLRLSCPGHLLAKVILHCHDGFEALSNRIVQRLGGIVRPPDTRDKYDKDLVRHIRPETGSLVLQQAYDAVAAMLAGIADACVPSANKPNFPAAVFVANVMQLYINLNNEEQAFKYGDQALRLYQGPFELTTADWSSASKCAVWLATVCYRRAEFQRALDYDEVALDALGRTEAPAPGAVMAVHEQSAQCYYALEDNVSAIEEALLAYRQHTQALTAGQHYLDPSTTLWVLGQAFFRLGQWGKASDWFSLAKENLSQHRPEAIKERLEVLKMFSTCASKAEQHTAYVTRLVELAALLESNGMIGVQLAVTYNNLALTEVQLNLLGPAVEHYQRSVEVRRGVVPVEYEQLALTLFNYAAALAQSRKHLQALPVFQEAAEAHVRAKGPKDRTSLEFQRRLAGAWAEAGEHDTSIKAYTDMIASMGKLKPSADLPELHLLKLKALCHAELASVLADIKQPQQAIQQQNQVYKLYSQADKLRRKADKSAPLYSDETIIALDQSARFASDAGLFDLALAQSDAVIGKCQKKHGKHPSTAAAIAAKACIAQAQGDLSLALNLWQTCYDMRYDTLGPRDPYTLQAMDQIGQMQLKQGESSSAMLSFETVLSSRELLPVPPPVGTSCLRWES